MSVFGEIEDGLSILKNLYDVIRIVDPINKKLFFTSEQKDKNIGDNCYCLWNRDIRCENCISMRAFLEDDTFIKLEYKEGRVYLVIVAPMKIHGNKYIVEIIKDISKNRFLKDKNINNLDDVEVLISQMNKKAIKDELTGV